MWMFESSVCMWLLFQMWTSVKILCSVPVRNVSTVSALIAVCPVSPGTGSSTGSAQVTHLIVAQLQDECVNQG